MRQLMLAWPFWALLSAVFAALTAILAKVGVQGVDSNYATFIRTLVIVAVCTAILAGSGGWQSAGAVSGRTYLFLVLSGIATGASWLCYFRALQMGDAARVAPVDKLSVVFVAILGAGLLGERLGLVSWLGVALIAVGAILVAVGG